MKKKLACAICGHRFLWIVGTLILAAMSLTLRECAAICCPECGHEVRAQFISRDVLEVA